jgi:hypothetical protein
MTVTPTESPSNSDPVSRLIRVLTEEGFTAPIDDENWREYGEIIYRRDERISLARGETIFILTEVPEVNEKIIRQAVDGVTNTYRAKNPAQKALSVLQSTTVYVCLISRADVPHNDLLNPFITRAGGATIIPVIIVPDINQVVYPSIEEGLGTTRPRIQYLQHVLGERRDTVDIHRNTIHAFYISAALLVVLVVAVVFSFVS